jgi:hypothetical protein
LLSGSQAGVMCMSMLPKYSRSRPKSLSRVTAISPPANRPSSIERMNTLKLPLGFVAT